MTLCAAYDFIPFPSNVTSMDQVNDAKIFLLNAVQPYRRIFDLQTYGNEWIIHDEK